MVWLYAALIALVLSAGGMLGYKWNEAAVLRAEARGKAWQASALGEKEARNREAAGYKVVNKYVDRVIQLEGKTVEVIKLIPQQIGCSDVAGVPTLDGPWRVSHDAGVSLANGTPGDTDNPRGTPEGVTPTQAAQTVVENYAACGRNREKLTALQEWVKTQKSKPTKETK